MPRMTRTLYRTTISIRGNWVLLFFVSACRRQTNRKRTLTCWLTHMQTHTNMQRKRKAKKEREGERDWPHVRSFTVQILRRSSFVFACIKAFWVHLEQKNGIRPDCSCMLSSSALFHFKSRFVSREACTSILQLKNETIFTNH